MQKSVDITAFLRYILLSVRRTSDFLSTRRIKNACFFQVIMDFFYTVKGMNNMLTKDEVKQHICAIVQGLLEASAEVADKGVVIRTQQKRTIEIETKHEGTITKFVVDIELPDNAYRIRDLQKYIKTARFSVVEGAIAKRLEKEGWEIVKASE